MYCQWIILAPWALQNLLNDWYPSNTEDVPSVLKYSTGRNQRGMEPTNAATLKARLIIGSEMGPLQPLSTGRLTLRP